MTKTGSRALLALWLAAASAAASAQGDAALKKMQDDQQYCYGLSAMAQSSVLLRNAGRTMDELLERRRASLGAHSAEYKLVEQITRQVYDKDLREPLPVAADAHRACLEAKGLVPSFTEQAVRTCPAVGLMVAEVSAARRRGAGVEQAVSQIGERYGALARSWEGGVEKLAARYAEGSKPDAGQTDYTMCMVLGMTGVVRP